MAPFRLRLRHPYARYGTIRGSGAGRRGRILEGCRPTRIIPRNDFGRMNVLLEERNAPASRPVLRLCAERNVLARDAIRTVVRVLTPTQPPVCLRRTLVQPA
jgi:hypothetical protein